MWDKRLLRVLKADLEQELQSLNAFTISYNTITNKVHQWVYTNEEALQKYPEWCSWVAMLFNDIELKKIATVCIHTLQKYNADKTTEYSDNIKQCLPENERNGHILDYVADHMNICNYARIEKWTEAKALIEGVEEIKTFSIDTIAAYSDRNEILWTISL